MRRSSCNGSSATAARCDCNGRTRPTARTSTSTISTATRSATRSAATCDPGDDMKRHAYFRLAILLALLPAGAWAASGQFIFVTCQVALQKANGTRLVPAKGTEVDP